MNDMPMPTVKSTLKIGDFRLYVFAYRPLTEAELVKQARLMLMKQKRKSFPKSGSWTVQTIIGFEG
jgi:hypothetical protein